MASPAQELSAAQKLAQEHAAEGHHVTIEDVPDDDLKPHDSSADAADTPALSAKAAGKQKETAPAPSTLDTQSRELFPDLGGPKPQPAAKTAPKWNVLSDRANGNSPANGTPRAATPSSGAATPTAKSAVPSVSIPGRKNVETIRLRPEHMKGRDQLRRPLPDIIKDLNRTSRATISIGPQNTSGTTFEASGPQEAAQRALKELVKQIGTPQSISVPIPQSARAHVIGKQGATIKSLQEKTGARIEVPKDDKNGAPVDELDDDVYINVKIEGNTISAAQAKQEIERIVGERAAKVNTKLRGIPAEFYPFIASAREDLLSKPNVGSGAQIRIPPHRTWSSQAATTVPGPGQRPAFQPAADHHIQLEGERAAVLALKAEIERRAAELREQLLLQQLEIQRGRHQFIIGDSALSPEEFFDQTGCAIILPTDEDDDAITIVGPADQIAEGLEKAEQLAMSMQMNNVDHLKWTNKQAPGQGAVHSKNVTRYLRQRREIDRLEKQYRAHINTPFSGDGALPWELYIPQGQKLAAASSDIRSLFESHPPSRFSTLGQREVDPFYYPYMQNEIRPHVRENYGVQVVIPDPSDPGSPILLVYEAPGPVDSSYEIPRTAPSQEDVRKFQRGLNDARKHIQDLLSQQEDIVAETVEVPLKFHEKLKKFIAKEQDKRPANQPRIRVSQLGLNVTLRGPATAVQNLAAKVRDFVEQEKADEKERGYTLEFDFPQKFANHLIGKGGSNIKELRDKFDVDIQVENGQVQLKGPKAKAAAARSHIESLGKSWADETTMRLQVDPKFHRELIGAQGSEINKLQNRYKVLIFFPRGEKGGKDDDAEAGDEAGKNRRQQAPDEVIIRGPSKGVSQAYDELKDLVNWLKTNSFTATVTVQRKQLPSLIGQAGTAMEAIRQQTETKIDVPNDRDSTDSVVEILIKGKKDNVQKAKKIIEEKKAVFDDTIVKTIDVERKYHRALIGAQGANLRAMVLEAGGSDDPRERARIIQFPKQEADGNTIKLEGRTDVVDKLIKQIEAFVAHRESQVTATVDVPTEKHRSLIGRGGDAKKQIESQFRVSIDIPRQGSGETAVKITGQEPDVEKAKEHIVNLTKEKPAETIQVPRSVHQAISNGGQFFRKLRNDFHVTVDHAGQTPPPKLSAAPRANGGALPLITDDDVSADEAHSWNVVESVSSEEGDIPWVLKGSPENIEKAKKAITTAMEQAQNNVTGYLVLPDPKTYRHVIGQGGSKVNSIRKQSGCKINVPRDQGEAIEVIGTKEGVEKAKDLILAAVRDGVNGSRARE